MTILKSRGLESCDGILGLSPATYGKHSFLAELKISGVIEHAIVSFSNAFFQENKFEFSLFPGNNDTRSYVTFGGYNAS